MRVTAWRFMRLRRKAVPPAILRRNLTRRLLSSVGVAALLAGASLALLPAPASADTSWTGAADSDWNNAANWSNGLPVNTSGTTRIEGPVAATVDGVSVADSGRTNIGSATQDGSLIVQGGGTLNAGVFELFGYNGFSGTATIRGAGSGISTSSSLFVGAYTGVGHIFIEDGGTLTTPYSTYMSQYNGSLGTVTVTGSGSTWNSTYEVNLGGAEGNYNATGILTIADDGLVNINNGNRNLNVAKSAGSTGTLNIGAAEGDAAVAAGSLQAKNVVFGAGDGTLVFNHTETDYTFAPSISGNGGVHQLAGTTILSGSNSWSGSTLVEGGILRAGAAGALSANAAYTVNGGTLDLNDFDLTATELSGTGGTVDLGTAELEVDQDSNSVFDGLIAGTGSLVKLGSGILSLTGASTFSGGTTLGGGTLRLEDDEAIGTGALTVTGGTLDYDDGIDLSNDIDLRAQATLNVTTGSATQSGNIGETGGSFGIVKSGAGILSLTGANTYTGATTVSGGTLRAGSADALVSGAYILNGGTLDLNDFDLSASGLSGASGTVDLGSAELEVDQDSDSVFGGIISGAGSLVKLGSGILSLTGANTYSGGTTISGGTLQGNTSSLTGNIVNNATLAFDQTSDGLFSGVISGTGTVSKTGAGVLTLSGTNTFTGGTTLGEGTLRLEDDDAIGTGAVTATGGTLDYDDGIDLSNDVDLRAQATLNVTTGSATQSGNIGETGGSFGIVKSGAGILELTGANTYTGATTVSGGTLRAGSADGLASGAYVLNGGTLDLNDFDLSMSSLSGASGTADLGSAELEVDQDGDSVFGGVISGAGSLAKLGSGILTLSGANTYAGGTTVSGGTLRAGSAGGFVSGAYVLNGGTLDLNDFDLSMSELSGTGGTIDLGSAALSVGSGNTFTNFAGLIEGTGSLEKTGTGELTLTGMNSYTGGTTISGGALEGTTSSLTGDIVNNATLAFTQAFDGIFGGVISGTGNLVKSGSGVVTMTGANSYTGGTTISGGVLEGSTSSLVGEIVNNATLAFTQAFDGTFGGVISGTGSLVKSGSGVLTLTGTNSWSGGTTISHGTLEGSTSSLTGDIVNDAALVFAQVGDGTFAGVVSGAGSLEKTGAGTLTLTGANGYTGGTTVSGGTLAGDASSLQGDIVNNAGLRFDQSADGTYAGVLSGNGDIVKSGAGSLFLTGVSGAFTGGLEVLAGSLIVDGTFAGDLLVSGGLLGGSGTVGSTTLGGGATLAAGNSIGTFTVAGDLAFSDGSALVVEVNDGGDTAGVNADFVHVTGAATIGSGAVVEVAPVNGTDDGTTYAPSTVYRVLTADGGISGVFGGVTAGFAFLTPELSYDATSVFLTLTQMAAFEDVASTSNQQGVAGATEALGAGNPLYDEIIGMSEEEAQAAFDALSGEAHASSTGVFSGSAGIVRRTIFSRLFSRFGAPRGFAAAEGYVPAAGDETPHGYTLWGELVRGWGETDGSASVAGIERNATGFLGGVDREAGEGSRIGFALGYSHAAFDVSGRSSSGESDNFHLAGYAGTELGPVDLKAVLGYSYQMAESRRRVVVGGVLNDLSADYGAHTFQASGEASLDLEAGSVTLTPFAGLAVVHVETEAFTETGGPAALSIASSGNTTGISELGLRAAREAGSLTLFGSASWRHVFGDVEPLSRAAFASAPATTFSVRGTPLSEDVASLGGGVEILIAEETTLELSYRGELASDSRDHGLKAKLRIDF
ncbi:MAG: autotransporter-associated beta strand repeat-containing protein [Parvibaculum sp.]|uniref:autotransporter-associated beta strand repeat-containing protein n=1 Tax=Parvibaculum sp. TaxID=2024848 RepID=UPI0032ED4126